MCDVTWDAITDLPELRDEIRKAPAREKDNLTILYLQKKFEVIKDLASMPNKRHEDILYYYFAEGMTMKMISKKLGVRYNYIQEKKKEALQIVKEGNVQEEKKRAKEYLRQAERIRHRIRRLDDLREEVEKAKEKKRGPGTKELTKILAEIRGYRKNQTKEYKLIEDKIGKIDKELYQDILYMRYIDCYRLTEIADELDRTYCYIRHRHIDALKYFEKKYL